MEQENKSVTFVSSHKYIMVNYIFVLYSYLAFYAYIKKKEGFLVCDLCFHVTGALFGTRYVIV